MTTKFYKRGKREFYMISKEKVMRVINKFTLSEVTIAHLNEEDGTFQCAMLQSNAEEGTEITREEFAKEFEVASRLIVLEP
jgi:propanediol dehydratase small subunit